jgi:hypothetical protein
VRDLRARMKCDLALRSLFDRGRQTQDRSDWGLNFLLFHDELFSQSQREETVMNGSKRRLFLAMNDDVFAVSNDLDDWI